MLLYVALGTRLGWLPPVSLNASIHTNIQDARTSLLQVDIFFSFIKLTFSFVCVLLCSCAILALLCPPRLYLLRHPVVLLLQILPQMDGNWVIVRRHILGEVRHLEFWHSDVGNRDIGINTISGHVCRWCYAKGRSLMFFSSCTYMCYTLHAIRCVCVYKV